MLSFADSRGRDSAGSGVPGESRLKAGVIGVTMPLKAGLLMGGVTLPLKAGLLMGGVTMPDLWGDCDGGSIFGTVGAEFAFEVNFRLELVLGVNFGVEIVSGGNFRVLLVLGVNFGEEFVFGYLVLTMG